MTHTHTRKKAKQISQENKDVNRKENSTKEGDKTKSRKKRIKSERKSTESKENGATVNERRGRRKRRKGKISTLKNGRDEAK